MRTEFWKRFATAHAASKPTCDELTQVLQSPGDGIDPDSIQEHGLPYTMQSIEDEASRAIVSALESVKSVIAGAKLTEVGPDFAGLTDVAEMLGVSRQNMRKLMLTHGGSFPAAMHAGLNRHQLPPPMTARQII